ncbi:MAG TPA: 50S ribosomal protein L22 [Spirochaetia bacterium]|jgi:large subunit ribosomal protein L22|nr:50S ribosomal protein L22 [Spirochaetia bacterium]
MEKGYRAIQKYYIISPGKVRRIADVVRNKPYTEAIAILESIPHKGARYLRKAIRSAASNALFQNKKLDEEMLYIKDLQVNEGPRMKRVWPRARGRRDILLKRMSHIYVVVDEIARMGE